MSEKSETPRRAKQFKTSVICELCGIEETRRSNNQVRCSGCSEDANRAQARKNEERKRRAAGIVAIGATVQCSCCCADFVKKNPAQKDCQGCVSAREDAARKLKYEKYEKGRKRVRSKEESRIRSAKWTKNNKKKRLESCRKYYERNKEIISVKSRAYNQREEVQERRRAYEAHKRATDPKYRLNQAMKAGLRRGLLEGKGGRKWEELTGFSLADLSRHLERQFSRRMTWDNYGDDGWHVDHIRPLDAYTFTTPECEEFRAAWCMTNLRPLWGTENHSKSAKITLLV